MASYGKLRIILLSEMAAGKQDSYRCRIAEYLLKRLGKPVSVEEVASACYVSKSAVSRFCRDIGLEDFSELKDLIPYHANAFMPIAHDRSAEEQLDAVASTAADSLLQCAATLDREALGRLTDDILHSAKVACIGLFKAEFAALNLHYDLTMLGKESVSKVAFKDQMDLLASADKYDLIIVFSYKGIFFDYGLPAEIRHGKKRIWIVTGNPDAGETLSHLPLRGILSFSSRLDFNSHPYQLITAASMIAQQTARKMRYSDDPALRSQYYDWEPDGYYQRGSDPITNL